MEQTKIIVQEYKSMALYFYLPIPLYPHLSSKFQSKIPTNLLKHKFTHSPTHHRRNQSHSIQTKNKTFKPRSFSNPKLKIIIIIKVEKIRNNTTNLIKTLLALIDTNFLHMFSFFFFFSLSLSPTYKIYGIKSYTNTRKALHAPVI